MEYKVNLGETGSCVSWIWISKFMGRFFGAYLLLLLFHEDAVLKTLCKAFYIALVTVWGYKGSFFFSQGQFFKYISDPESVDEQEEDTAFGLVQM